MFPFDYFYFRKDRKKAKMLFEIYQKIQTQQANIEEKELSIKTVSLFFQAQGYDSKAAKNKAESILQNTDISDIKEVVLRCLWTSKDLDKIDSARGDAELQAKWISMMFSQRRRIIDKLFKPQQYF